MSTPPPDDAKDHPAAQSYIVEWAWDCPECGESNSTADIDESGTVGQCDCCHVLVRIVT